MNAPALRRLLFAAAFLTAVVSAALVPGDVSPPKRASKSSAQTAAATPQSARALVREVEVPTLLSYRRSMEDGVDVVDIFEARVPAGAPGPAAKPVPPGMPFIFVGMIEESGRTKAVLTQGDQLHMVEKGEQFGGAYRLEEISTDQAIVTYLPLDVRQTVSPATAAGAPGVPGPPGFPGSRR
jgi:hypothetical protein